VSQEEIEGLIAIRLQLTLLFLPLVFFPLTARAQYQQRAEIASSLNPVGSGARALGMGGSFIAVADDATAASWNPGGLVLLGRPEISVAGAFFRRDEDNNMGTHPEASGKQSISEARLNYLSLVFPFVLFKRNMIVSVNYQYLFDFSREWVFSLQDEVSRSEDTFELKEYDFHFRQEGSLSAIGIAYCIQITPKVSFGFTLNVWEDPFYENGWKQTYHERGGGEVYGYSPFVQDPVVKYTYDFVATKTDEYSFSGFNANVGLLWNITSRLTLGAVVKTPFTANLEHESSLSSSLTYPDRPEPDKTESFDSEDAELKMPMSYGIGLAYRFADNLTVTADVTRTEWQDFVLEDSGGNEISPISGLPRDLSDIDPTHQVRLGAEYLIIRPGYVVPVRAGLFYDPAPAEGSPDDYFGCSLGSGLAIGRVAFDIAYQFRFGRGVGSSLYLAWDFSQDVYEHTLYSSLIVYF
jgi:long-subunit fatty acid transport protein